MTGTPIVLVVDAKGMGKSVLALIAGFLQYDTEKLIRGVILNRMSGAYFQTIRPLIEKELPVAALGYVPDQKHLELKSRHLGLVLPKEQEAVAQGRFRPSISFGRFHRREACLYGVSDRLNHRIKRWGQSGSKRNDRQ